MPLPVLQTTNVGFPAQYASKITNIRSNQQGDSVSVTAVTGDTLVAIAIGLRDYDPFDLLHGTNPAYGSGHAAGYLQGLNDFNAVPTIGDSAPVSSVANITAVSVANYVLTVTCANSFSANQQVKLAGTAESFLNGVTVTVLATGLTGAHFSANVSIEGSYSNTADTGTATFVGNSWTLATSLSTVDSDYTAVATPPAAPNPYPSSSWNLDGYYPSIYIWTATGVAAGTYNVTLESMFQNGVVATNYAAGEPIFDGGVNFQVIKFSGILTSGAADGASIGTSTAAAAAPTAFATTQGSELLLAVGLMKSGNVFGLGSVIQAAAPTADAVNRISNGKLVGSEAHYMVEYAIPASGSATTQLSFSNPLGYEMIVANIALKHS